MYRLYQKILSSGSGSSSTAGSIGFGALLALFRASDDCDRGNAGGGPDIGDCALLDTFEPSKDERSAGDAKYGEDVFRNSAGFEFGVLLVGRLFSLLMGEKRESFEVGMKAPFSSILRAGMMMMCRVVVSQSRGGQSINLKMFVARCDKGCLL